MAKDKEVITKQKPLTPDLYERDPKPVVNQKVAINLPFIRRQQEKSK